MIRIQAASVNHRVQVVGREEVRSQPDRSLPGLAHGGVKGHVQCVMLLIETVMGAVIRGRSELKKVLIVEIVMF